MFRIIPGNNEYVVSLSQEFRKYDGSVAILPKVGDRISIELYGQKQLVCPKWLSLIAHFEITLPNMGYKALLNVIFVDLNITFLRPVSGKIPIFKSPVTVHHHGRAYRIIPSFSKYAVSSDGEVIEVASGAIVKITPERKKHGVVISEYPSVYIYNPERLSYKYLTVHRLVAMTWVKNPHNDFVFRPIVNHIDGNKRNFHYKNLEWCSFRENNIHAVETGLKTDNIHCKIRDYRNGEIRQFSSLSQAEQFMGLSRKVLRTNNRALIKARLINDKYEFKLANDNSPWFYENRTEKVKLGRYLVEVEYQDGRIEQYHDTRDFKKKFNIWNCPNMEVMLNRARIENFGIKFTLIDFYRDESIQAYNVQTGEVIETKTIMEMSKRTGIREYAIRYCIRGEETWTKSGYAFRYKTDKPWNISFIDKDKEPGRKVKALNLISGEVLTFDAIRQVARYFSFKDRSWLRNCIENGKEYNGWKFQFLNEQ
jgi:hypothetical protein